MKLSKIEWRDHESRTEWVDNNELDNWLKEDMRCVSVGYIVKESKDAIIICAEKSSNKEYSNCTKILKSAIIKLKR